MDIKIPIISTAQLYLRPWVPEDVGELFTILQEKDILHYFPGQSPPSWEKVERYIEHHLTHWVQFSYGHWAAPWMEWARIPASAKGDRSSLLAKQAGLEAWLRH